MSTAETVAAPPARPAAGLTGKLRAVPAATWAKVAFAVVCALALAGFLAYPTYPQYDSLYSLIWGREVLHGHLPSFVGYRTPTEHPLSIAFSAALALVFGTGADRVMLGADVVSFLVLVWGMYRLGRVAFTPLIGAVGAALLLTRLDFGFLAARGYVDIPYLALVVWAGALEAGRPRRGWTVLALLAAAGLLRPEGWLLAGLYLLWIGWPALKARRWGALAGYVALTAAAPVIWGAIDKAVTGDALYSLHSTSGLASTLGRQKGLSQVPGALWHYLVLLDKTPILLAGIVGIAVVLWLVPRRLGMPAALLLAGIGTFLAIGVAGLSVIERYMLVPSLALMIFAAVTIGGASLLRPGGRLRRWWGIAATVGVLFGIAWTGAHLDLSHFDTELAFRGQYRASLNTLLHQPAVERGLRCGPVSLPNHKLIPDTRWLLGLPAKKVVARSQARAKAKHGHPALARRIAAGGVAIYPLGHQALVSQAFTEKTDDPRDQLPLPGYHRAASTAYYSAYVRCAG